MRSYTDAGIGKMDGYGDETLCTVCRIRKVTWLMCDGREKYCCVLRINKPNRIFNVSCSNINVIVVLYLLP